MELKLKKQPQKYLASVDAPTRKKLYRALDSLSRLEGDTSRSRDMRTDTAIRSCITA